MKPLLFTILLVQGFYALTFSQVNFQAAEAKLDSAEHKKLNVLLESYEVITLNPQVINEFLKKNPQQASLSMSFPSGFKLDMIIKENEIRAPGCKSVITTESGVIADPATTTACNTYLGHITDDKSKTVGLYVDNQILAGTFYKFDKGTYTLHPLSLILKSGNVDNRYVLFSSKDSKLPVKVCGAPEMAMGSKSLRAGRKQSLATSTSCKILEVATEGDYDLYQIWSVYTNGLILYYMNLVDGIYNSTFGIRIMVVYQNYYSTSGDPYSVNNGVAVDILAEFKNYWNSNRTGIVRDWAHLFTNRSLGSAGGVAYIGVICSNSTYSYGVTEEYNYEAITTAHEIGHGFNAAHADSDPGSGSNCSDPDASDRTVMCSNGSSVGTFSSYSQSQITSYVGSNNSCLLSLDGLYLSVSGPQPLCSTGTYYVNVPSGSTAYSVSWSSSNTSILTINSSTGVATKVSNGSATITATVTVCSGTTVSASMLVVAGPPIINSITVNTSMCAGAGQMVTAFTLGNPYSLSWAVTSGNASNAYFSDYGNGSASFNSYIPDCYGLTLSMTNNCGSSQGGTTICVDNCFGRYAVYPNPAKDVLIVEFGEVKNKKILPERIDLFEEKSVKKVLSIDIREAFDKNVIKADGRLNIKVEDLPRGIYYLHIINNETVGDKLMIERIVLN